MTIPEKDWLYGSLMYSGEKITIIRPQFVKQRIIAKHIAALSITRRWKHEYKKPVGKNCRHYGHMQLNDLKIDPLNIASIMINEVVPSDPAFGKRDSPISKC